jgi:threonine/homoserine/homoserine lactone efflux protein
LCALRSKGGTLVSKNIKSNSTFGLIFWQGTLITLFNPQVAIFFLAFLPQFVVLDAGPAWAQLLLHGLLLLCVSALIEPPLILAGEKLTKKLRNNPNFSKWLDRSLGMLLIALGIRLAFQAK